MKKLKPWQIALLVVFWPAGILYLILRLIKGGEKKTPAVQVRVTKTAGEYVDVCDRFPSGTVFVYPGSAVYHTDYYCSQGVENDPEAMPETEAAEKGYRKCKKCTEYTCRK